MKKDIFNVADKDFCSRFLLQAISQQAALIGRFPLQPGPVEVKLYINGIQHPFRTVIENLFERMSSQIDSEVEERVQKLGTDGLKELEEVIFSARSSIELAVTDAVEKLAKKEVR